MWKIVDFRPIYQRFLESGKSVRKFCSDEGIEEGRFYHWQVKVRTEAAKGSGEFLPVSINNRGGKVAILGGNGFVGGNAGGIQPLCEIVYPNGVKIRFFLYPHPTDMRKSFYTLSGIVTNRMHRNIQDGDAFIFIYKPCTSMKILHMECGGLAIYNLKLERVVHGCGGSSRAALLQNTGTGS